MQDPRKAPHRTATGPGDLVPAIRQQGLQATRDAN